MKFTDSKSKVDYFPRPLSAKITSVNSGVLRVYFMGTYWPAKLQGSGHLSEIGLGEEVKVVGRENITLLVEV